MPKQRNKVVNNWLRALVGCLYLIDIVCIVRTDLRPVLVSCLKWLIFYKGSSIKDVQKVLRTFDILFAGSYSFGLHGN